MWLSLSIQSHVGTFPWNDYALDNRNAWMGVSALKESQASGGAQQFLLIMGRAQTESA